MSEERTPDAIWRYRIAARDGKKTLKIELFSAAQWRIWWRPYRRNMHPKPPLRDDGYWQRYFRLRVDGRWYADRQPKHPVKYCFFTHTEAARVADALRRGEE